MRQAEQRIFRCDRFRRNGVQSGSGDLAAAQGFGKGGAGHKVAAGSVDDECAVLHARQGGQHNQHEHNAAGPQQGGAGEEHALQDAGDPRRQ